MLSNSKNYFIKKEYRCQKSNFTVSQSDTDRYWSEERVFFSFYLQYDIYKYARKIIKKYKLKNTLDLGCGVGTKLMKLIYPICTDVTGVDQNEAIDYCKKTYHSGTFKVDNLENPAVSHPAKYDIVICSDVIEHLIDPDVLLNHLKQLCHKNTFILFSTPERDILRGKDCMGSDKPEHVREWNSEEFAAYLKSRGFNIIVHKLSPFTKFSFNKEIFSIIKKIKKKCGTIRTNQLVLCNLT
jgi:2-polyprenyl-3-methyl-5-hydroxy-6-metoxy-1,4-benzoquinol methylase